MVSIPRRRLLLGLLIASFLLMQGGLIYVGALFSSPLLHGNLGLTAAWDDGGLRITGVLSKKAEGLGFRKGDRLLAVTDARGRTIELRGPLDLFQAARLVPFDQPFTLRIEREAPPDRREELEVAVPPIHNPRVTPWPALRNMAGETAFMLICLLAAAFIGFLRTKDDNAYTASLLFICLASFGWGERPGAFPPVWREIGLVLWIVPFSFATALFMRFFLLFPIPSAIEKSAPWLKRAGLGFAAVFSLWNFGWHYVYLSNLGLFEKGLLRLRWLDITQDVIYSLLFLVGLASLIVNTVQVKTPDERRRLRILLAGALAVLPWLVSYVAAVVLNFVGFPAWFYVLATAGRAAFPVAFVYAVVRHRIFGIRVILRKGIQFALLSKGFLFLEAALILVAFTYALVPLATKILGEAGQGMVVGTLALCTMGAVVVLRGLNRKVMPVIEKRFFRENYDARQILTDQTFRARRLAADPERLGAEVVRTVSDALHPAGVALFLRARAALNLPLDGERFRRLRKALAPVPPNAFFCWRREPAGAEAGGIEEGGDPWLMTGDGLLDGLLNRAIEEGSGALDVDPKNPRSQARPILQGGSPQEVDLIEGREARLLVPLTTEEGLLGFLALGAKLSEEPYSAEDVQLLAAVARQTADTLEHARLIRRGQEQAQLRQEVEIARQVQENLLPKVTIPIPRLDYAGACRPARFVGGDYFDFFREGEAGLCMALGDISGKGVAASLLMASLQAMLRVQADSYGGHLDQIVAGINRRMCSATGESRFATLFLALFDPASLSIEYINAGHNPPVIFRPAAQGAAVETHRLGSSGTVLGIFQDARFEQKRFQCQPGDVLLVISDGVTDALNESEEFFEEERLQALVKGLMRESAQTIVERVLEGVTRFSAGAPQYDDMTIIVARVL